ncbi:MAG TPA: ParM/StbA family protein [Oculatellaceae cyanobacterium]|jgi:hypothetical protein
MNRVRLQAYLDLGSSATKGVYWAGEKFQWLWMMPQYSMLSPTALSRLSAELGSESPESAAWIKVGNCGYAIGSLAKANGGDSAMRLPKKERAVYKILAAIGVIAERLNLSSEFELDLGVVLPIEEFWADCKELRRVVAESAKEFVFRGQQYRVVVNVCQMRPEGMGLYLLRRLQLKNEDIDLKNYSLTILMFGHRNLSILRFDRGSPPTEANSTSQGPGFMEYLRSVANDLAAGVAFDDPILLEGVLSDTKKIWVPGRGKSFAITEAMDYASQHYIQLVGDFMMQYLSGGATELLVAGGAAYQIQQQLLSWFKSRNLTDRVMWSEILLKEFQYYLPPKLSQIDTIRYCDVYGAFKGLIETYPIGRGAVAA